MHAVRRWAPGGNHCNRVAYGLVTALCCAPVHDFESLRQWPLCTWTRVPADPGHLHLWCGTGHTGFIRIPEGKAADEKQTNYTFLMDSDDGSQLYIDGKLIISDTGARASFRGVQSLHADLLYRARQAPQYTSDEEHLFRSLACRATSGGHATP